MKTTFQAKDIQEILRIPKIRYEYLARQIGIIPEIEEAEGTGNAHKYSFRNLIQFAIAERCSITGLSMKQIKHLMELLHQHHVAVFSEPAESSKSRGKTKTPDLELEAWFYGIPGGGMFVLEGEGREVFLYKISSAEFNQTMPEYYSALKNLEESPDQFEVLQREIQNVMVPLDKLMNHLDGCIHINIGQIRNGLSAAVRFHLLKHRG